MVKEFFEARTFAVVGAARSKEKVGYAVLKNLLQNKKNMVFPVNPNASKILGQKCYQEIGDIPSKISCVIIAVKAELVPDILAQAGKKQVKCAIVVSSGFSESGNVELENEIVKIAEQYKIKLLGPNVLGFINSGKNLNASFFSGIIPKGGIVFLSQSGALGVGVLDLALKSNIGFSGFVSLGNCAQLDFSDFIDYYSKDSATRVIALYIESLKENKGRKFLEACKRCKKPILALKAGRTAGGIRAASSHTAALASAEGVYSGMFREAGIIEVDSISELLNFSRVLDQYGRLGKRACIITNAGGLGVLTADACSQNGLELVPIPVKIQEKLHSVLPPEAGLGNPIDLLGDALAERYQKVLKVLDGENFFDFFIVLLTPQFMIKPVETAQSLVSLKKPVFACFYGGEKVEEARKVLVNSKIITFNDVNELKILGQAVNSLN